MKPKFIIEPHPFLFAAYSILGVLVQNLDTIPIAQVFRPLVIVLLFTGLLYFLFSKPTGDSLRAAYLSTLVILWLLFFGHIYRFAAYFAVVREIPGYRFILHAAWTVVIGLLASPFVWKRFSKKALLTKSLNAASAVVLIAPIIAISMLVINTDRQNTLIDLSRPTGKISLSMGSTPPDIYYIILDGYGRQDVLEEMYGYDNSKFIDFLLEKGFYVASESRSNYLLTQLSLPSSLNFTYLDFLSIPMGNSQNRVPVNQLIQHSTIRQLVEENGYQFVTISSFALFNQVKDADVVLSPVSKYVSEFEGLLLSTSILDLVLDRTNPDIYLVDYNTQRKFVSFAFEMLPELAKLPGPKFVFVHIWAPHPPFVFDALGNPIQPNRPFFPGDANGFMGSSEEYIHGYSRQINYVDDQMVRALSGVMKNSTKSPVIIVQGDHGPGAYTDFHSAAGTCLQERFSILNAYFFPDQDYDLLYPEITPVNSFRVILNKFFAAELDLLEDRSYYSLFLKPYQFTDITEQAQEPCRFSGP